MKKGLSKQQSNYIIEGRDLDITQVVHEQVAIVSAFLGKQVAIVTHDGKQQQCYLRRALPNIVVGDRILWQDDGYAAFVTARIKRKNVFAVSHKRLTQGKQVRPPRYARSVPKQLQSFENRSLGRDIAANIDQVMIVFASSPKVNMELIDRFLLNAQQNGIEAILVATKRDMDSQEQQEQIQAKLANYQSFFSCHYVSTEKSSVYFADALRLRSFVGGKTTMFVGQSGVGKSSLLKAWQPNLTIPIGELSKSGAGRHTTSVARCFVLDQVAPATKKDDRSQKTLVIDCPGVQQLSILPIDEEKLQYYFPDIDALAKGCAFRHCTHTNEPHCCVQAAMASSQLAHSRLESFFAIKEELKNNFF